MERRLRQGDGEREHRIADGVIRSRQEFFETPRVTEHAATNRLSYLSLDYGRNGRAFDAPTIFGVLFLFSAFAEDMPAGNRKRLR